MGNELIEGKMNAVSLIQREGLENLIKPLNRETFLLETHIAGVSHSEEDKARSEVRMGDKLILQREDNVIDPNAILVFDEKKRLLGYLPEKDNMVFARMMDAGKLLTGKVKVITNEGYFRKIEIRVYMVDF